MSELKLYVWNKVFCDHSDGIAFALAESESEARDLILKGYDNNMSREELNCEPDVVTAGKYGMFMFGGG